MFVELDNANATDSDAIEHCIILLNVQLPSFWRGIWQRCSYRVCADGGANALFDACGNHAERLLFLPSCIAGDFDSIRSDVREFYESNCVDLRHISDQDTTDLDKCLAIASSQSLKYCIHVCTSMSGRFDHLLSSVSSCASNSERLVVLRAQGNTAVILPANGPQASYTLVGCALFTHLSVAVVPICGRARVTATGLRWPLASTQLEMGRLISTSNRICDDTVCVASDGMLLLSFSE